MRVECMAGSEPECGTWLLAGSDGTACGHERRGLAGVRGGARVYGLTRYGYRTSGVYTHVTRPRRTTRAVYCKK
jgi:hypothetical protein